jgi:hypothetical protein
MRSKSAVSLLTLSVLMTLATVGAGRPAEDSKLQKKALDILKQASDVFKNAKTIHTESKTTFSTTDAQGKRTTTNSESVCDCERPNHFAFRARRVGEPGGASCVCDGKNLLTSTTLMKEYTLTPAAADLYKVGAALMTIGLANAGQLFLDAFGEDPYENFMAGVNTCTYGGKEKVGEVEAHCLKFTQDQMNWEMWVAAEGKPFVLKIHTSGDAGNGGKFELVETFTNWKLEEPLAKGTFTISPAKDATQVQNLDSSKEKK